MRDIQPRDNNKEVVGIDDVIVAKIDGRRYKVLSVDNLLGSGAVKVVCLFPVEPGSEQHEISRYDLWQGFVKEE